MKIKVEYLQETQEIELDPNDTLDIMKAAIAAVFGVPVEEQTLVFNERSLNIQMKSIEQLGIREQSLVHVKKIHKFFGKKKQESISSMMKNPLVKNMFKNPSTMKSIQEMFPGLKEELEENSTLSTILNTQGMDEELEMISKDDEYMNTYLRNADITMSKLQNLPEGMRLLNSVTKDSFGLSNLNLPKADLKIGLKVEQKIETAIPGKNRRNLLVEYRKQLFQLKQIGFENVQENIEVLKTCNGDLEMTVQLLSEKYTS